MAQWKQTEATYDSAKAAATYESRLKKWQTAATAARKAGKPVEFITMEKYLAPKWQTYAQEVARMRASEVSRTPRRGGAGR